MMNANCERKEGITRGVGGRKREETIRARNKIKKGFK